MRLLLRCSSTSTSYDSWMVWCITNSVQAKISSSYNMQKHFLQQIFSYPIEDKASTYSYALLKMKTSKKIEASEAFRLRRQESNLGLSMVLEKTIHTKTYLS